MEGSREGIMDGDVGNGVLAARKSPKTLPSAVIATAATVPGGVSVDRLSQTLVTR
jgi:hypothetical protein